MLNSLPKVQGGLVDMESFHRCNSDIIMLRSKQEKLKTRGKYKTCHPCIPKNMLVIEEIRGKSGLCLTVAPRLLLSTKEYIQ